MRDSITVGLRRATLGAAALALLAAPPRVLLAQSRDSVQLSSHYWPKFGLGFTTSILLHEAAHIMTSYAVGGHPSFGFDKLRPTIYSGISARVAPHKQFLFSISGLTMQNLIDEGILDIPHSRGSAFERGVLAGGIGTTLFYLTIGRQGSVSDVDFIARTHAMTKAQVTMVFGTITAAHVIRISRNPRYANFFARPGAGGGLDLGMTLKTR
jgi:hypothetical protein